MLISARRLTHSSPNRIGALNRKPYAANHRQIKQFRNDVFISAITDIYRPLDEAVKRVPLSGRTSSRDFQAVRED
jgi:hypothetical protein